MKRIFSGILFFFIFSTLSLADVKQGTVPMGMWFQEGDQIFPAIKAQTDKGGISFTWCATENNCTVLGSGSYSIEALKRIARPVARVGTTVEYGTAPVAFVLFATVSLFLFHQLEIPPEEIGFNAERSRQGAAAGVGLIGAGLGAAAGPELKLLVPDIQGADLVLETVNHKKAYLLISRVPDIYEVETGLASLLIKAGVQD